MPLRRDKDDAAPKHADGSSLLPPDSPFDTPHVAPGAPSPADQPEKKKLFGGRKRKDEGPSPFEPPRLDQLPPVTSGGSPEGRGSRPPLVTPWTPAAEDDIPSSPLNPTLGRSPWAAPPADAPTSTVSPPPPRPSAGPLPDPDSHEMEFVFAGKDAVASPTQRIKAPTLKPSGGPGRQLSRSTVIALVVLLLLIAGVAGYALFGGGDDEVTPTVAPFSVAPSAAPSASIAPSQAPTVALPEECVNGFAFAAKNQSSFNTGRTTTLCPTVEQWLEGARRFPAAIGASAATDVGNDDVVRVCQTAAASPMCRDATAKSYIVTPAPSTSPGASPATSPAASVAPSASVAASPVQSSTA